jgi:hypothetical protein
MWSKSTLTITEARAATALVASRRPPSPTSSTATSARARAKASRAAAVITSKNEGCVDRCPWPSPSRCARAQLLEQPLQGAIVHVCALDPDPLVGPHEVGEV